jgi:hypothetical protein
MRGARLRAPGLDNCGRGCQPRPRLETTAFDKCESSEAVASPRVGILRRLSEQRVDDLVFLRKLQSDGATDADLLKAAASASELHHFSFCTMENIPLDDDDC